MADLEGKIVFLPKNPNFDCENITRGIGPIPKNQKQFFYK